MPGEFSSKRNFLFDLDGTLIDSTSAHARAYVETLRPDFPMLAENFDYAPFAGRPTRQVFAALGMAEPALGEATQRKQRLYREALERGEVKLFPGVLEMLARLGEADCRLFLVSGASRISVERTLESMECAKFFSGVITAEDAPTGKPSADPYLVALTNYSLAAEESLAIEDSVSGVRSAQEAGLDVVLIHTDLEIAGVARVRNCGELLELVFE